MNIRKARFATKKRINELFKQGKDLKKGDLVKLRKSTETPFVAVVKSAPYYGSTPEWFKADLRMKNSGAPEDTRFVIPNKMWLVSVQIISEKTRKTDYIVEECSPTAWWEKVNVS